MMAMIVAIAVLNKSTLYYFKYVLNDPAGGQLALAAMGLVSGISIPLWMLLGRFVGLRALWLVAGGARDRRTAGVHRRPVRPLARHAGVPGRHAGRQHRPQFRVLGNASEHHRIWRAGDRAACRGHGVRAWQRCCSRIAIGIATAILGWGFDTRRGYVANSQQSAATLAGMRATIAVVPLLFLLLSCAAMLLNPLGAAAAAGAIA